MKEGHKKPRPLGRGAVTVSNRSWFLKIASASLMRGERQVSHARKLLRGNSNPPNPAPIDKLKAAMER